MAPFDSRRDERSPTARRRARLAGRGRQATAAGRALMLSPPRGAEDDGDAIRVQGIEPALGSLGILIGLLRPAPGGDPDVPAYILVSEWFQDPLTNLTTAFNENSAELAALMAQLLGQAAGQALGVPIKDAALLGTWYPLVLPVADKPHGLYLVNQPANPNGPNGEDQIFGLGVLGKWQVPDAKPLLAIDVWGTVPLLRVGGGTVRPVVAETGYPLTLGTAVQGVDGQPLFDLEGISFSGVKVTGSLDLARPAVSVSVVALRLKLPGDKEPADRSLTDLLALTGPQIQDTIAGLFVGALSQISERAAEEARYLLPMLGIQSTVPGVDVPVPQMRWDQFLSLAIAGGDLALPFKDWFGALAANPDQMAAWMAAIGGAVGGSVAVSGSGTRGDPLAVVLLDLSQSSPPVGTLSFTMGATVDAQGVRLIYPGLAFQAVPLGLGASSAVIQAGAILDLAQFQVANGTVSFGDPTALGFSMGVRLADKTPGTKLAEYDGYSARSLSLGIGLSVGQPIPVPRLSLDEVATPDGPYGTLDLLNPGELAAAAEDLLPAMVQQQLEKLLGVTPGGTPVPYASNVATLIGMVPPPLPEGASWPADLPPPFSAPRILATIADPVSALGSYYFQTLTSQEQVGGRQAFTWMIEQLTGLLALADLGAAITVAGSGTPDDPWRAALTVAGTPLPAHLTGYTQPAERPGGAVATLVVGLDLAPRLELNGTRIDPSLSFDLIAMDLPAPGSAAPLTALWAPLLAAVLSLPDGFTSPSVGGAVVSVGPSQLSGRWSRTDGWAVSLLVADPVLTVDGHRIALGQSLDFADLSALEDLVRDEVAAFLDMITGLLGVALLRLDNRAATTVTGIMGLLKDVNTAQNFPANLTWPDIEPLHLTTFADPWPAIRQQIARDLATPETAAAVLSLLGWTLDGDLAEAPAVPGAGTVADPYRLVLKGCPFDLTVWTRDAGGQAIAGAGLCRRLNAQFASGSDLAPIVAVTDFRLDLVELNLVTGALVWGDAAPQVGVTTSVARTEGPLVPRTLDAELGALQLGLTVRMPAEGGFQVAPVLTLLDVTLPGEQPTARLTLAEMMAPEFADRLRSGALALVNAGVQGLCQAALNNPTFRQAYDLLTDLGIALPFDFAALDRLNAQGGAHLSAAEQAEAAGLFGINPGGWSGLLSAPFDFAADQFALLLIDPVQRQELFDFLQAQLGIDLPAIPQPVLDLLCALDLLGPADQGYPLLPDQMLTWLRDPFGTLTARVRALLTDPVALEALKSLLKGVIAPPDFGPFTFTAVNASTLTLEVKPENAPDLAGLMTLFGRACLDLDTPSLNVEIRGYIPMLGLGPLATLSFDGLDLTAPRPRFAVAFGDGTLPAPPPVGLYPFDSQVLVDQLSTTLPMYALSVLTGIVVEGQVLNRYPLVQQVFQGLGLAQEVDGRWTMPALSGLMLDPLGWLMSEGVLGSDGQFDVAGFARWLSGLPRIDGPYGLKVEPLADGVRVAGMPYGVNFALTGKDNLAEITLGTENLDIAQGVGRLDALSLGLRLDPLAAPGFFGSVHLSKAVGSSDPFFVKAGYDGGFALTIGQQDGGGTAIALDLLPYRGLGSLLEQLARQLPAVVVNKVVPALLDGLERAGAADFVARMRTAGQKLDVADLIGRLSALDPITLANVEAAGLGWLRDRLSEANAPNTAQAVVALLDGLIPGTIGSEGGLVRYAPSDRLPLTLLTGLDATGGAPLLGVWAELNLPDVGRIRPRVRRTGLGVPLSGDPSLAFVFGVGVTVAFEDDTGPTLSMDLSGSQGLVVAVDPVGSATGGAPSELRRELLPAFFPAGAGPDPGPAVRFQDWLLAVVTQVVPRYVAAVVLNQPAVSGWLDAPLFGGAQGPTPGTVLVGSSLLRRTQSDTYALMPFEALLALSPETFAAQFLRELLKTKLKVLSFGPGGSGAIWVEPDPNNPKGFGARVVIPSMPVPGLSSVVLHLGDDNDAWIKGSGGDVGDLEPGIAAYVPLDDAGGNGLAPQFDRLRLAVLNVGLDFVGANRRPLIDFTRFTLGGVGPRGFLSVLLRGEDGPDISFGVAARATGIGLSLSPEGLPKGGNPVAANLLGSGGGSADAGAQSDDTSSATNPTFTALVAYSTNLFVELANDDGTGNPVVIPVQRNFGPIRLNSIGVGWDQPDYLLSMMVSGGLALAGLSASVESLTVGIPVRDITNLDSYRLDLQGLGLQFQTASVNITGGFEKTTEPSLAYTGVASVVAAKFGLSALGSYTMMPTTDDPDGPSAPSLFVFASLNVPLGPDPAFFITGLAGGFAYNRSLTLPAVSEVASYPLISIMKTGGFPPDETPSDALRKLSSIVAPAVGQYWLAAGFKFNTYQLFDGLALAVIQFGRTFEIDLLGVAAAGLPTTVGPEAALTYVELGLKAVISPEKGVFSVEAQLTPNSFVLYKDVKLTGGFAFYLWFKTIPQEDGTTIPAGDFVITLGGYNPAFQPPPHYPSVPRLGLQWQIDVSVGKVGITGGAYFALVPSAVMAGGYLNVAFEAGPIRAWLDASANFIIQWQPFWFQVDIGVSVGVAFKTTIAGISITLSAELGATLHLEGPPTHGHVKIDWTVISFTIPIGDARTATTDQPLDWAAFEQCFVPTAPAPQQGPQQGILRGLDEPATIYQPLTVAVESGRLGGANEGGQDKPWVVSAVPFSLRIDTALPATRFTFPAPEGGTAPADISGPKLGIRPMAEANAETAVAVEIIDAAGKRVDLAARGFGLYAGTKGAPAAIWSNKPLNTNYAPSGKDMTIDGALANLTLAADAYVIADTVPPFPIGNLKYELGTPRQLPFAIKPVYGPAARYPASQQARAMQVLMDSIMAPAVITLRNAALTTLRARGIAAPADPSLSVMATSANLVLQAPPLLARPGVFQAPLGTSPGEPEVITLARTPRAAPAKAAPAAFAPRLLAVLHRHRAARAPLALRRGLPPARHATIDRLIDGARIAPAPSATRALMGGAASPALHPGTHALWQVGDHHALKVDGGRPVRLVCLDDRQVPLADVIVSEGLHQPPPGTTLVLAQGMEQEDHPARLGWQIDSPLLQVASHVVVGDGCVIRPAHLPAVLRHGRTQARRLLDGKAMLAGNRLRGAGGALVPGWVQTVFPGTCDHLEIRVAAAADGDLAEDALRVTAAFADQPGQPGAEARHPDLRYQDGAVWVLVYALSNPDGAAYLTTVVQPMAEGIALLAVHAGSAARLEATAEAAGLAPAAIDLAAPRGAPAAGDAPARMHPVAAADHTSGLPLGTRHGAAR